ncbi:MAG: cation diffusion facilitator family transporter [Saccharofermentans sp.]|nr:cation diffusion facilitator family transporter [Saccharofermentans sp.]
MDREKTIVKTGIIGIVTNILLAAFKAFVGLLSNSIAIILDAVNNLSDALSSTITIIGTKLAGKKPDKKHPMGHGRIEYISAAIISMIVLYAGITSLIESVKKIINPVTPEYKTVTLIIVAVAVVVKIVLGTYVKKTGEKVNSDALKASGKDALFDSIISASTLVAAIVFLISGVGIEAYLGAAISVIIIKSGIDMLRETLSQILGERVNSELTNEIKKAIRTVDGVKGAYDLLLHNYGPDRYLASVHIEVDENMTAAKIDAITREIQHKVLEEHQVIITTVGIYADNTSDDEINKMRQEVYHIVRSHDNVLQIHGFFVDKENKRMSLDYIMDFAADDLKGEYGRIYDEIKAKYPDYDLNLKLDINVSE